MREEVARSWRARLIVGIKTKSDGTELLLDFVDPSANFTFQQW